MKRQNAKQQQNGRRFEHRWETMLLSKGAGPVKCTVFP